ncbi:hypothetical protein RHS01_11072 [Rhizoctonia solani]|uniref:Uncharacterized protein n=1 Tax=Rhizoctonia solani TaxID=456999 RepID=A0A8H7I0J2_9AGAM|nr:hypothetical protein RHS01_11072 [Rhizoctonia solani]
MEILAHSTVPNNFSQFIHGWISANRFPPEGQASTLSPSILTLSAITDNGFHFQSGAGTIEVLILTCWTYSILTPYDFNRLKTDEHVQIDVAIGSITGTVIFRVISDPADLIVSLDYLISTPYGEFGIMRPSFLCMRPLSLEMTQSAHLCLQQRNQSPALVPRLLSSHPNVLLWEGAMLTKLEDGKDTLLPIPALSKVYAKIQEAKPHISRIRKLELGLKEQSTDQELLDMFLSDFAEVGGPGKDDHGIIALPTVEYLKPAKGPGDSLALGKAEGYTVDVSFLVFSLQGTVNPTQLYIEAILYGRVPLLGRIEIISLKGSLIEGVKAGIDIALAKGEVTLKLKQENGEKVVYVDLSVSLMGLGTKTVNDCWLFPLP